MARTSDRPEFAQRRARACAPREVPGQRVARDRPRTTLSWGHAQVTSSEDAEQRIADLEKQLAARRIADLEAVGPRRSGGEFRHQLARNVLRWHHVFQRVAPAGARLDRHASTATASSWSTRGIRTALCVRAFPYDLNRDESGKHRQPRHVSLGEL